MELDTQSTFILHAEDDVCDVRMMKIILNKINFKGEYKNLSTGIELFEWIQDRANPTPDILILDIGLPGIDGKELLTKLRKNESTCSLPIIMMSGSSSQRDYQECIALGTNAYIQKTANVDGLEHVMKCFVEGWSYLNKQTFL